MTEPDPRVSLVVPLHNSSLYTRIFLVTLREILPGEPRVEVVLVDNGSTDDTPAVLAELAGAHRVVSLAENKDFAGGCNIGAAVSQGELLFFLNNDMVPTRGFVSAAVEAMDGDERIAIVGSKLLFPGGRIQHAGIAFDGKAGAHHLHEFLPADHPAANRPQELQAVTGAALLVRRADFDAVGGFDTAYRNSFEDVDFCLRVRERGRKVVYCPTSVLFHFRSSSDGRHDWDYENFRRFVGRWHGKVEADLERRRVADVAGDSLARGLSVTSEVHQLLADSRRDALAWRTRFAALEARGALVGDIAALAGENPRVLHVDCPDSLSQGSGRTATVLLAPGQSTTSPLTLGWSWSGPEPSPGALDLAPPFAPAMEVCVPLRAPGSPGRHELVLTLGPKGAADGVAPAWCKAIQVRPLHGATYHSVVPARLPAGRTAILPVYLTNEGMLAWEGGDFRLSYHWRGTNEALPAIRDGWRTYLPHAVAPGEGVSLRARIETPSVPGAYVLEWDMVIEGVSWFSELGVPAASHAVEVYE